MTAQDKQRGFLPFFTVLLIVDLLASIAYLSGNPDWEQISLLWLGPFDDICFGIVGVFAIFYLLDPLGKDVQLPDGGGYSPKGAWRLIKDDDQALRRFGERCLAGGALTLGLLAPLLISIQFARRFEPSVVIGGVELLLSRHLHYVVPIVAVALVVGAIFRLKGAGLYTASLLVLGEVSLLLSTSSDGRWQDHFYHLLTNLENPQAWLISGCWIAYLLAVSRPKQAEPEVAV